MLKTNTTVDNKNFHYKNGITLNRVLTLGKQTLKRFENRLGKIWYTVRDDYKEKHNIHEHIYIRKNRKNNLNENKEFNWKDTIEKWWFEKILESLIRQY